jgi:hypothetical protein
VSGDQRKKQDFVVVLEQAQEDMLLDRFGQGLVAVMGPVDLAFERVDPGWQQAMQPQQAALLGSEGRTLVEQGQA